jgi:hypothetical protein
MRVPPRALHMPPRALHMPPRAMGAPRRAMGAPRRAMGAPRRAMGGVGRPKPRVARVRRVPFPPQRRDAALVLAFQLRSPERNQDPFGLSHRFVSATPRSLQRVRWRLLRGHHDDSDQR